MASSERTADRPGSGTSGADSGSGTERHSRAGSTADAGASAGSHASHGHSTAAWALVGTVLLGGLVASVAVVIASVWVFVLGVVVMVAGVVLGKVLSAMGFGQSHHRAPAGEREQQNVR